MAFFKNEEDGSELQEKNKLLLQDEKRFKNIFERSAVGESIVDLDGHWLDANERLCEMVGYSKKELLGKHFKDITHPDDIERSEKTRNLIASGKTDHAEIEKRYIHKNGSIVWVLLSIALMPKEGDKPAYFIIHTQDITEFKKIEKKLEESEEKYRTIIENVNYGVIIVQDLVSKFVNSQLLGITGYSLEEIQEKPFTGFIVPEFAELVKENYKKRIAGNNVGRKYEIEIIKKDGTKMPAEVSGSVINYEGKPADMVFIADISERKKREEELAEFKFIIDQSNQQIGVADLDGNLVYANESLAKNHGYEVKDLIGKKTSVLHPKEEDAKFKKFVKILMEKGYNSGELVNVRRDGSKYVTYMDNFVLKIDSKPKYLIGMGVDITDLKNATKEIEKQKSLLDSIVRSTNDGLLVIDRNGKVTFYNDNFAKLWKIPENIIKTKDDRKLLDYVMDQLADPKEFINKVDYLYKHPEENDYDTVKFKDGRIFDRISTPQRIGEDIVGRIWGFSDVTKKTETLRQEKEHIEQVERMNKLAIGRELKMVELKKEIEDLKKEIKNK